MPRFQVTACWVAAFMIVLTNGCIRPFYGPSCSEMCGTTLENSSGAIHFPGNESPNGEYKNNEDCSWFIVPKNENSSVLITFESFDTEAGYDYVDIFVNNLTHSSYSGNKLPFQELYNGTGPIRVQFHSDISATRKGFNMSYSIFKGAAPRFVSLVNDTIAVRGDNVSLPCHVTGIPKPGVTWYKDGLEIYPASHSTLTMKGNDLLLKGVLEEDSGVYKCRAENFLNATESVVQLTVYVPPVIVSHPTDVHLDTIFNASVGDHYDPYGFRLRFSDELQVVFYCAAKGVPKPNVYWKKDGVFLGKPTTVSTMGWLVIKPNSVSDAGNYTCFVNNTVGNDASRAASLTIGKLLPCCLYMKLQRNTYMQVTSIVEMSVSFKYDSYTLSHATMTKDGHSYLPADYQERSVNFGPSQYHRVDLNLGALTDRDNGIYGWHLHLISSSPTVSTTIVVSSYIAVVVQGPPHVLVAPFTRLVHDIDEQLVVACSVDSSQSLSTFRWFDNNTPLDNSRTIEACGRVKSYLILPYGFDGREAKNYTCSAVNQAGISRKATVTVVERADARGWSWWIESTHCSTTCGIDRGIRLRRRRCFSDTRRCRGSNIEVVFCFPPKSYCPSDVLPSQNTSLGLTSSPADHSATLDPRIAILHPTVMPCARSSDGSVVTASAISAVVTGIVSAVIATALTYCFLRQKNRKQMSAALESLRHTSSSGQDTDRYTLGTVLRKQPDKRESTVRSETEQTESPEASTEQYEEIQRMSLSPAYTVPPRSHVNRVYENSGAEVRPLSMTRNTSVTMNKRDSHGAYKSEKIYQNV